MQKVWEGLFVEEPIRVVVDLLRAQGIAIRYDPQSDFNHKDPEHDNAFIDVRGGLISSCIRWRRDPNKANIAWIPEKAMAYIDLRNDHPRFAEIQALVLAHLHVQPHSEGPPRIWALEPL